MDYEILLSTLQGKASEFEGLSSAASSLSEEGNNSLNSMSGTEISTLYDGITSSFERLKKGYNNCNQWLNEYTTGLDALESSLASFNCNNIDAPKEFKGEFIDMFGKKVIPTLKNGGDTAANLELGSKGNTNGLSNDELQTLLAAARSQENVTPYCTMTYAPDGGGFGCAMYVAYCYNQTLFNGARGDDWNTEGFYGSTYEFWGNVTNDGYEPHNKGFVEVSAEEAQPGDVVCYTEGSDPYSSYAACSHVALYMGDGQILGSYGSGYSGPGVIAGDVESQAQGYNGTRDIHYLHYVGTES